MNHTLSFLFYVGNLSGGVIVAGDTLENNPDLTSSGKSVGLPTPPNLNCVKDANLWILP